jgi:2-polyprenyl-6-methoxyphenol hydroxylase-like FAD-dependent oxidoreductase
METVNVRFKAQVANRWVVGRTMVAGDAAHNFPPFGGQGIASGFRDSISLAWRLNLITKNPGINYEELLTGWYVERKQQVEVCMSLLCMGLMEALAATVFNGGLVCQRSKFKSWLRNVLIRSLVWISPLKHTLEMGPRGIMMRYK